MLRSTLIYLSKAAWARNLVTNWKFAWNVASRFVAGDKLEDAIRVVRALNERGINATLDHLGEHTYDPADAERATQDILDIFDAIDQSGVCAGVSIKLTQIGLALDKALCAQNLQRILAYASERDNFVRIDMEDSPWVDVTLELYNQMRQEHGLTNTGLVLQSYLYRTADDARKLMEHGGRVRLCKGAYKEPPDVAYPSKKDVDASFDRVTEILIDGAMENNAPELSEDCRFPPIPAIGTHDPLRLAHAKEYAQKVGLPKKAIEFQMLHGIRRDLQEQAAEEGYPVRIYVPYGTEWYPYFVRRLAERPANLWFFISNFFRK
jgi:proline dehydrogenase